VQRDIDQMIAQHPSQQSTSQSQSPQLYTSDSLSPQIGYTGSVQSLDTIASNKVGYETCPLTDESKIQTPINKQSQTIPSSSSSSSSAQSLSYTQSYTQSSPNQLKPTPQYPLPFVPAGYAVSGESFFNPLQLTSYSVGQPGLFPLKSLSDIKTGMRLVRIIKKKGKQEVKWVRENVIDDNEQLNEDEKDWISVEDNDNDNDTNINNKDIDVGIGNINGKKNNYGRGLRKGEYIKDFRKKVMNQVKNSKNKGFQQNIEEEDDDEEESDSESESGSETSEMSNKHDFDDEEEFEDQFDEDEDEEDVFEFEEIDSFFTDNCIIFCTSEDIR
ncbi:MAG: hypothetical protein EZS28_026623, partial [Streblomastix strix]